MFDYNYNYTFSFTVLLFPNLLKTHLFSLAFHVHYWQ